MGHVVLACPEYIAQIFELHAQRAGIPFVTCHSLSEVMRELRGWPSAVIVGDGEWLQELDRLEEKWPLIDATSSGQHFGYATLEPSCDFGQFWCAVDESGQCWNQKSCRKT